MFLPLAHTLARMTQMLVLDVGGTIAYWRGDPKLVLEDLAATRPTHVPSVPRVYEKVHTKALAGVEESGRLKRAIFHWALDTGRRVRALERQGRTPGGLLRRRYALADKLVLSKVRGLFGPDIKLGLTGAAPIAQDVLEFFDACGVLILEGYGMTETTAAATLNTQERFRFGTVGRALPGAEIAIAEDGEVLMRGPHVFPGYFRNEDATRETFTEDGWLRSGDLGSIDDGRLPAHHRSQEGPDHHLERQEHQRREPRVGAARDPLGLPGGRVRRQPSLPGGGADARPRRGAGAGRTASVSTPTRPSWRRTSASTPSSPARSRRSTSASPASSRSSASRSSTAT